MVDRFEVTFVADWGLVGTDVNATDDDHAVEVAREYLHREGGIPWDVLCLMPHVEVEHLGTVEVGS